MLKFTFTKTGKLTGAFSGDQYQTDYNLSLPNGTSAHVSYRDFHATINIADRVIHIKPVMNGITITRYLILEGDTRIGIIRRLPWWNGGVKIVLDAGVTFSAKRVYKTVWDRMLNSSDYTISLSSEDRFIKYTFQTGTPFSRTYKSQQYRALEGDVESTIDDVFIPSLGFVLIELILIYEDL